MCSWSRVALPHVHYRTGSLETLQAHQRRGLFVHYRTGSLEIFKKTEQKRFYVHYRTGSLET